MNDEVFEEKLKKAFQQEIEVPDMWLVNENVSKKDLICK